MTTYWSIYQLFSIILLEIRSIIPVHTLGVRKGKNSKAEEKKRKKRRTKIAILKLVNIINHG